MVLTRSVRKARSREIARWLPDELITEIIRNISKADQANLCRVSKLFRSLTLPVLNRDVALYVGNGPVLDAFCSALLANPARADAIRSFTLWDDGPFTISDQTFQAMKLMTRLEHLGAVHQMTPEEVPDEDFGEGTSKLVPGLAASNLGAFRLEWISSPPWVLGELTIDETIVALNSLTTSSSPFVSAHDCLLGSADTKELLRCLSTHMPHTMSRASAGDESIDHVTEYLPRFNRLAFLSLDCIYPRSPIAVDRTWAAVQTWATACPTLGACNVYGSAWRKVDRIWQEYSVEEFLVQAGVSEFRLMFN
ncbi:hypothetical protein B0H11DRAFT_1926461 [Mycena galericulata]|nr:hypothetical protein B0H11DRAFT_1926461 [Mycena galericulata]